jgi:hypothetical protein
MKRVLALLLGAFVVVWAAALFDFTGHGARAPAPERAVIAQALPAVLPEAAQPSTRKPAAMLAPAVAPSAPAAPLPAAKASAMNAIVRAAQGSVAVIGKAARALLTKSRPEEPEAKVAVKAAAPEATGELGEGVLSPEFQEYERRYASEPRDGDWAPAQERRVRALLEGQPWADKIALVHCQQTTCRIVIEAAADAQNPFTQLIQVPGLSEATGLRSDTPYSLRTGQLSVYFGNFEAPPRSAGAVPPLESAHVP